MTCERPGRRSGLVGFFVFCELAWTIPVTFSALTPLKVSRVSGCRPLGRGEVPFEHPRIVR